MKKKLHFKIFSLVLISAVFFSASPVFAALSCTVAGVCNSPDVVVLKMFATSNSHAELPSESNYTELLCCSGVTGLANSCTDDFGVVLRLSGTTNAHVEENTETTLAYDGNDACLSVPDGTVTIGYQNTNCTGFDTTVASLSSTPTNSHIGEAAEYTRKVCATVTTTPVIVPATGGGGGATVLPLGTCRIADFNCDGRVDILDLSILLYYTNKSGAAIAEFDLSEDGKIDLSDISIVFYYWDI